MIRRHALATGLLAMASAATAAEYRLVTTHPAEDSAPTVSPDGRWLVYTSTRDGASALYLRDLAAKRPTPDVAFFPHPARTESPVFSPGGRHLAFVSNREDALGDVFLSTFPGKSLRRISNTGTIDGAPWFSPDGETVSYQSNRVGEAPHTAVWSIRKRAPLLGTPIQKVAYPNPPYPELARDPLHGVALLLADDTNRDGVLGDGDMASAWEVIDSKWRAASFPLIGAQSISLNRRTRELLIAANWVGNLDIAAIGAYPLRDAKTYEEFAAIAREEAATQKPDANRVAAAWRAAWMTAASPADRGAALRAYLGALNRDRRHWQAKTDAQRAVEGGLSPTDLLLVEAESLIADLAIARDAGRFSGGAGSAAKSASDRLRAIEPRIREGGGVEEASEILLALAEDLAAQGLHADAIADTDRIMADRERLSRDLQCRTVLVRARVYTAIGLGPETEASLLEVFAIAPNNIATLDEAAAGLIAIARGRATSPDGVILELRNLAANSAAHPYLFASIRLEEGRSLVGMEEFVRAETAFREATPLVKEAPGPAIASSVELARLLTRRGSHDEAIALFQEIEGTLRNEQLPESRQAYDTARRELVRAYLDRARRELRLGDAPLAAATYGKLLEFDDTLPEAWRGYLAALSTRPEAMTAQEKSFRAETSAQPRVALGWYKLGLAISYREPSSREALRAIETAIAIDSSVPYFQLTRGYILEQRYRRAEQRGRSDVALLEEASLAIEQALFLANRAADPQLFSDALLNAANVSLALKQYFKAYDFYRRRDVDGVQSGSPVTEFLFRWNHGLAAFRASFPSLAAEQFDAAITVLDEMGDRPEITKAQAAAFRLELMDRRALALMEASRIPEARAAFADVYRRAPEGTLGRVRSLRNQVLLLAREAAAASGVERVLLVREGRALVAEAQAELARPDLKGDRPLDGGGGLFNINLAFAADATEGASQLGFDKGDENRILRAALGHFADLEGDNAAAAARLQELIALAPRITEANRAYQYAAQTVTYQRLGAKQLRLERADDATKALVEGLRRARFEVATVPITNVNAASMMLASLAEALRQSPAPTLSPDPEVFWMLAPADLATPSPWALLELAATRMLELPDPVAGDPALLLVSEPAQIARLVYTQALAAEAAHTDAVATLAGLDGLPLIEASAKVASMARRVQSFVGRFGALELDPFEREEFLRLRVLLSALPIRIAARSGDSEQADRLLADAVNSAEQSGFGSLSWWLAAQAAMASPAPETRQALAALALERYLALPHPSLDDFIGNPWSTMDQLEAIQLSGAVASNNPEAAWDIADAWRVARLRWLALSADPTPAGDEDATWVTTWRERRDDLLLKEAQLRGLASAAPPQLAAAVERSLAASEALSLHIAAGRDRALPSAMQLHPQDGGFDLVSVLLQPPFLVPRRPVLVLNRELPGLAVRAVYTPEASAFVPPDQPLPDDAELFLLGDAPSEVSSDVVQVLSGESLLAKFSKLSLRGDTPVVEVSAAPAVSGDALAFAYEASVTDPVRRAGPFPQRWLLSESGEPLRDVIVRARNLERIRLSLSPDGAPLAAQRRAELGLAAWMDQRGLVEAVIDGAAWLGMPMDPARVPDLAQAELAMAQGTLERALATNAASESVSALERIVALMEALGERTELQLYYGKLAEDRGRLDRWADASRAAERRVALLEEAGAAPVDLAGAVRLLGGFAANAREWDAAEAAYLRASAFYRDLDDIDRERATLRDSAIALENAGRYHQALARGADARALGADPRYMVEQDIRSARILRIYLSRFDEAIDLLTSAEEFARENGLADLAVECRVNIARALYATSRFEEAMAAIDAVEKEAAALDLIQYESQVPLERANVHWLRSEYFEAFREQATAMNLARRDENVAVEIAARNVSGLTSWSVNDLKRAYSELDQAMELATAARIDSEVASTANNIGVVLRSEERLDEAIESFREALAIDQREENRWGEAHAQRNIGITLTRAGRPADAIAPIERAVLLAGEVGDETNLSKALLALGDARRDLADCPQATAAYGRALELARRLPAPEVAWRALYGLGLCALSEGRQDDAQKHLAAAIDVVDGLRASIRVEEFQDGFLLDKQELYDAMIELLIARGDHAAALESSEKSRGRNFIDLLGNRRLSVRDAGDQKLLDQENEIRTRIEEAERRLASATDADRPALDATLARARQEYSDFMILLRTNAPELSSFVRVEPVNVAELQALIDPGTRLLVYHLLPNGPVCWVLGPQSLDFVRLPGTEAELAERLQRTRASLQEFASVDADLKALGDTLIVPLLPFLNGAERIGVVPHGSLHVLPFAALRLGERDSLVDRFALFSAPSASVMRYTVGRRPARAANNRVLAIGNPDLGTTSMNLPFAEKEAERIRYNFDDVTVLVAGEATETFLKERLGDYGIIHIASHGEFKPDEPLFSAVLLAADSQNDGVLSAEEVFGLELRADLIALSACQSGLGRLGNGDDVVGLNRAFVYAGTRQLLTTLWRVDDISTAVLFKYFYRYQADIDRAEALRRAQVRLKNRPEYQHPAHWSALVLGGDWQ